MPFFYKPYGPGPMAPVPWWYDPYHPVPYNKPPMMPPPAPVGPFLPVPPFQDPIPDGCITEAKLSNELKEKLGLLPASPENSTSK